MKKLLPLLLLLLAFLGIVSAPAPAATFQELRQAEKISLSLTGKPLSKAMRTDFVNGKIQLSDIAESLSKSPGFIDQFAQFWTVLLNIQTPVDYWALRRKSDDKALNATIDDADFQDLDIELRCKEKNRLYLEDYYLRRINKLPFLLENISCDDAPIIKLRLDHSDPAKVQKIVDSGKCTDGTNILPGTADVWRRINDVVQNSTAECGKGGEIVHPWWDPVGVTIHAKYKNAPGYRVGRRIIEICGGPSLPKCSLMHASSIDKFSEDVNHDMTMEPGWIIGHTVAEDKPYSEIVTTQKTIMTGTYGYFMSKRIGQELWPSFVNGSYAEKEHPVFSSSDPQDSKHYWVDRGPYNAGVLTTIGFQISTNGNRAKANRAFQAFTCQTFKVPDGVPIDDTDDNPDLTKRRYCSSCHIALEPMAAFFNRWPEAGVNNFMYNTDPKIRDDGKFLGKEGPGALGFGKILGEADTFKRCGIERAFEFVNGRKMTEKEAEKLIPGYLQEFKDNGEKLRPIIKSMVLTNEFLNPGGK